MKQAMFKVTSNKAARKPKLNAISVDPKKKSKKSKSELEDKALPRISAETTCALNRRFDQIKLN